MGLYSLRIAPAGRPTPERRGERLVFLDRLPPPASRKRRSLVLPGRRHGAVGICFFASMFLPTRSEDCATMFFAFSRIHPALRRSGGSLNCVSQRRQSSAARAYCSRRLGDDLEKGDMPLPLAAAGVDRCVRAVACRCRAPCPARRSPHSTCPATCWRPGRPSGCGISYTSHRTERGRWPGNRCAPWRPVAGLGLFVVDDRFLQLVSRSALCVLSRSSRRGSSSG